MYNILKCTEKICTTGHMLDHKTSYNNLKLEVCFLITIEKQKFTNMQI